ncbi:MAG TPA: ABC transporter permease [Propioniciclava sp.]|uniref:ABC transporter permease n=1 Tax=Propioniciclava sp. TaxID=2038686 RepID=UPI002B8FD297|nr:ABC transporter permease [Propioniciclava sp.]HRL49801.1 ABC transporter permease [Propioniciclava sp.]HRL79782.1 ABC transporter permease [Propioniciclava sp.]
MTGRVLRRFGAALATLVAASILVWIMLMAAPTDPVEGILRARGILEPDPYQVAAMRAELGLDDPPVTRYLHWLAGWFQGDFGVSWKSGRPVAEEIAKRLPATVLLTGVSMAIAVVASVLLGVAAASFHRRAMDTVVRIITLALVIVPSFLLGLLVLNTLVLRLKWGRVVSDGTWLTVWWPALTLACGSIGYWARVLRASVLEARSAPYLMVSRARGASLTRQLFVHALPNALPPWLTVVALGAAGLLGGAPIVEAVFTWPGVGAYTVTAINAGDAPVVLFYTMFAITSFIVVSLLTDVLVTLLDPRLRTPKAGTP